MRINLYFTIDPIHLWPIVSWYSYPSGPGLKWTNFDVFFLFLTLRMERDG